MDFKPVDFLSLGAGVQSSTEALMRELGELAPKPNLSIFSDTMWEPRTPRTLDPSNGKWIEGGVYGWLDWLEKKLSYPVIRVSKGDLMAGSLGIHRSKKTGLLYLKGLIPAFLLKPDGKVALLGRKCTPDYKVQQIVTYARNHVGKVTMLAWRKRHKAALKAMSDAKKAKEIYPQWAIDETQSEPLVTMAIGISIDEVDRVKPSHHPWIKNYHPLVDAGISRDDCKAWMKAHGFPEPPRSACIFCPFHSDYEWKLLKETNPIEWAQVVKYERDLQAATRSQEALIGMPYLHRSCIPIDQVVFGDTPSHVATSMFPNECTGLCGV